MEKTKSNMLKQASTFLKSIIHHGMIGFLFLSLIGSSSTTGYDSHSIIISGKVGNDPVIAYINPSTVTAGDGAFTLTVVGQYYVTSSVVQINGADRTTVFISSTTLSAYILASDIASTGYADITVYNTSTSFLSNTATLTIKAPPISGGGGGSTTPPALTGPSAINVTEDSARIVWNTDVPANSIVEYGLTSSYGDTISNTTLVTSHGIDLTGLEPNTTYHYRVISTDQWGNTIVSGDYTFTTLPLPPLEISNVASGSITDTTANIVWDTNRASDSYVMYGTDPSSLTMYMDSTALVYDHSIMLTALEPETAYYYQVISVDAYGISDTSSVYSFTTGLDLTPPANVQLNALPGDTYNWLEWTIPPDADYTGIRIVRRTDGYPAGPYDGVLVYDGTGTNTIDAGLINGVTYYYAAYAYDDDGNFSSGALDAATPTTPPVPPEELATTLIADPGNTTVLLTWTIPVSPDFAGVRIMRSETDYPMSPFEGVLVYDGTGTSFLDTDRINGVTYYYTIFAYDINDVFGPPAFDDATPSDVLPPVPLPPSPGCTPEECGNLTYDIYIINPDGSERHTGTDWVRVDNIGANVLRYNFEDKGDDWDYNDVVIDVNVADCRNLQIDVISTSAVWHHQIHIIIFNTGVRVRDGMVWPDTHTAIGQTITYDAGGSDVCPLVLPPIPEADPLATQLIASPGNGSVLLTWAVPISPDYAGVIIVRSETGYPTSPTQGEVVYDGLGNSFLDTGRINGVTYYYTVFAYDVYGTYGPGASDSATPSEALPPVPPPPTVPPTPPTVPPIPPVAPPTPPTVPPTPPTIIPPPPIPPITPPSVTPGPTSPTSYQYYTQGGTLPLQPGPTGNYNVPSGAPVLLVIPPTGLPTAPQSGVMIVAGQTYALTIGPNGQMTGSFVAPASGTFTSQIIINYVNGTTGTVISGFTVQGAGLVVQAKLGPDVQPVSSATVTLYQNVNGTWVVWNGAPFGQSNPVQTNANGNYIFVVPNGQYYAVAQKDGYITHRTPVINVVNNVFRERIALIAIPDEESVFAFPIVIEFQILQLLDLIRAPEVVEMTNQVIAPALIAVSILNLASALSLFNLLAYLQFLFTQPVLLFGRLRKRRWGLVYNSLNKQPVETVIVRLLTAQDKKIVQTKVTDREGRYIFSAKKGNYLIAVAKPNFAFPTTYLADKKDDVVFPDIYHGEMITLQEDGVIALNIPVDPIYAFETPRRVIYKRMLKRLQHVVALLGVVLALIAFIISPTWFIAAVLLAQIGFYLLFRQLALPAKAKPWGRVTDKKGRPIRGAVVRIFDKQYNKLLETQATNINGKYGFFAEHNIYYVTVEKPGYVKYTSPDLDLKSREETVIDLNVKLEKQAGV